MSATTWWVVVLAIIGGWFVGSIAAASLWSWWRSRGKHVPTSTGFTPRRPDE